ncbi:nicotinate phosphoribosyltransferase [Thoreauomyces humboldtii]|nr:nicotinate phosphoribosyltransferase [Thoreauomyces humboldtii]
MSASILDNDLYKFAMQQAVCDLFPTAHVEYRFKDRMRSMTFGPDAYDCLQKRISDLSSLRITPDEIAFLAKTGLFTSTYLTYLQEFTFKPSEHIHIHRCFTRGRLSLQISGLWPEVILYEVPLLALISETYFEFMDTAWTDSDVFASAAFKTTRLIEGGCTFTEFGTRRRRSAAVQDTVVAAMKAAQAKENANPVGGADSVRGKFAGTSNVHLAMKYGLEPVGTVAHEWIMAISVLNGSLEHANRNALERWLAAYPTGHFRTALSDTYGTAPFLSDFTKDLAETYQAVRQDSGDPRAFFLSLLSHYDALEVDCRDKAVVFSDSLDVQKCLDLLRFVTGLETERQGRGLSTPKAKFGVGTNFTNDFVNTSTGSKSNALNIVIKLHSCGGKPVVKLSDDQGKHHGDEEAIADALRTFGLASENSSLCRTELSLFAYK